MMILAITFAFVEKPSLLHGKTSHIILEPMTPSQVKHIFEGMQVAGLWISEDSMNPQAVSTCKKVRNYFSLAGT